MEVLQHIEEAIEKQEVVFNELVVVGDSVWNELPHVSIQRLGRDEGSGSSSAATAAAIAYTAVAAIAGTVIRIHDDYRSRCCCGALILYVCMIFTESMSKLKLSKPSLSKLSRSSLSCLSKLFSKLSLEARFWSLPGLSESDWKTYL